MAEPTSQSGGGAGPSVTTCVYDTRLGPAALSWSRSLLGLSLSLRFLLRLCDQPGPRSESETEPEPEPEPLSLSLCFCIRPWIIPWRRRGSKRIHFGPAQSHHALVSWDLTHARFGLGPEPLSRFFVSVSVNGELALVAGDLVDEAYRASKPQKPICISGLKPSVLVSRREHVQMQTQMGRMGESCSTSNCSHRTRIRVWGREMDISIRLLGKEKGELGFCVGIDGKRILLVKRLKWKFRGSEKIAIEDPRSKVQVSWDLHSWIFPARDREAPGQLGARAHADAVFVFKFEKDWGFEEEEVEEVEEKEKEKVSLGRLLGSQFGTGWKEVSAAGTGKSNKGAIKGSLMKTGSSSSSTSSTDSSGSGSTIMGWSSAEEIELRRPEGFSLLVYASKSKR